MCLPYEVELCVDYHVRNLLTNEDWALIFDSNDEEQYVSDVRLIGEDVLVVGFELPPVYVRQLVNGGCKVISFTLSPIRFLSDLAWNIELHGFNLDLRSWGILDKQMRYEAGLVKAATMKLIGMSCPDPTALLVGQTLRDRSVIENGKFLSLLDFTPIIADLCQSHHTIFKPHPHEKNLSLDYQSAENINIYKLLSEPTVKTVISVSSSVLEEAHYFGKKTIALKKVKPSYEKKIHISTKNLISPNFWHFLLSAITETKTPEPIEIPESRHLARQIFGAFWGMDFF